MLELYSSFRFLFLKFGALTFGWRRGFLGLARSEFFNAPRGIYQLLFTRVKRMTSTANFHMDLRLGRPGGVGCPTGAANLRLGIVWRVDVGFHIDGDSLPQRIVLDKTRRP